ncbi:MAG: hypothetical protein Q7T87_13285 [Polaromonas sp.]|nr:hypothetical protein [Polaromonas sp.]
MIRSFLFQRAGVPLLMCALLAGNTALIAHAAGESKAKSAKSTKAEKTKAIKFKLPPSSEESRGERIARLKRECKGGVNAGACEGFTR